MRPFVRTIKTLELDGGRLCLDFVNTVKSRYETPRHEFILYPDDWLIWIRRMKIVDVKEEKHLKEYIALNRGKAVRELRRIIKVRECLYRIFRKIVRKEIPREADLRCFSNELSRSFRHLKLEFLKGTDIIEKWNGISLNLLNTLHPIVKSAYDLLFSVSLNRVKECGHCGWLFLDSSRNNSRKWCNMKTCGNTVKTGKYYYKKNIKL